MVRLRPAAAATSAPAQLPLDAKVRGRVGIVLICVFVLIVVAQLVPESPWNALDGSDNIGRSALGQRWNLFAPSPPSANLATFVVVRYRDASGVRTSQPDDLSTAVRRVSVSSRWTPPKLVRVVTKLNVAFERQVYADARAAVDSQVDTTRALPPTLVRQIERRRAQSLAAYRRLLSASARGIVPAQAQIVSVRGLVVRTPVNPFDARDHEPVRSMPRLLDPDAPPALISPDVLADVRGQPTKPAVLILDSGWMPYERHVEPLEVPVN